MSFLDKDFLVKLTDPDLPKAFLLFKEISLKPLSCDSLNLAYAAINDLKRRYPTVQYTANKFFPRNESEIRHEAPELGRIPKYWRDYAISYEKEHSQELWYSILKEDIPVQDTIVEEYLRLLRLQRLDIDILKSCSIKDGTYNVSEQGNDRPAIIPLQMQDNGENVWAFIVAYSNCIHYYNSQDNSQYDRLKLKIIDEGRPVQTEWAGPQDPGRYNSGLYMLLGIRRIRDGYPHISQQAATEEVLSNFRVRLLIELLCGRLDPSEEEVRTYLQRDNMSSPVTMNISQNNPLAKKNTSILPIDSSMAGNAENVREASSEMVGDKSVTSEPLSAAQISVLNSSSPATVFSSVQQTTPASQSRLSPKLLSAGQVSPLNNSTPVPVVASSTIQRYPKPHRPPRQISELFNTMEGILELLSKACLACRLSNCSNDTSLAILWHSIKEDCSKKSKFHQRYNEVLFYNKMERLRSEKAIRAELKGGEDIKSLKTKKKECKFWDDVCKIGEELELENGDQYVMLLAISSLPPRETDERRKEIVEQLRSYLREDSNPLRRWLLSAKELCAAIVKQSLPTQNLMIDLYYLKKGQDINETSYELFVSIDAHKATEIKRI